MTFTKTVKNELITVPIKKDEMLAEFSSFLNLGCEFHIEDGNKMIDFITKSPTVTKRFLSLSKTIYKSETVLLTKEQKNFTKKPLIILRITDNVNKIISEHEYLTDPIESARLLTPTNETKIAFLRAAFLTNGSINDPKTAQYHMEIFANKSEEIIFLQSLMNHFNFNARITKRRKGFIVYLKDAETISDFMQLVGAYNSVFKFEDLRIRRDMSNSINRIMNCEIANEKKSVLASNEQLKDIELIEKYYMGLDIDLKTKEAMDLRVKYPDATLTELTNYYQDEYNEPISRSGLNHRLSKIKKIAEKIREEAESN